MKKVFVTVLCLFGICTSVLANEKVCHEIAEVPKLSIKVDNVRYMLYTASLDVGSMATYKFSHPKKDAELILSTNAPESIMIPIESKKECY